MKPRVAKRAPLPCAPFSNNEVADLIKHATGEEVSYTTIWKLRNG